MKRITPIISVLKTKKRLPIGLVMWLSKFIFSLKRVVYNWYFFMIKFLAKAVNSDKGFFLKKVIYNFIILLYFVTLSSCQIDRGSKFLGGTVVKTPQTIVLSDSILSLSNYLNYYNEPNGLSHRRYQLDNLELDFVYKTPTHEALNSLEDISSYEPKEFVKALKIKERYRYFEIWIKPTRTQLTDQSKSVLDCLSKTLKVVINDQDTLQPNYQFYPASMEGASHKLSFYIQNDPKDKFYRVLLNDNCGIELPQFVMTKKDIEHLPKLNLNEL